MRFETKGVYMTSGVQAKVDRGEIPMKDVTSCLEKHFFNRGEECKDDNELNEEAIKYKSGRVMSTFNNVAGHKIWIITEGFHLANDPVYGREYPMTTILFPDEY